MLDTAALARSIQAASPERLHQLLGLLDHALEVIDPEGAVARVVEDIHEDTVTVVALGKAAPAMTRGAYQALGQRVRRGLVVTDHVEPVPEGAELVVTSHPVPDSSSVEGGRKLMAAVTEPADRVLVLISGGGSALAEVPAKGVALEDLVTVNRLLLRSGAPIEETNVVRACLSAFKGGGLAFAAHAPTTTVVHSDVGPRLDLVASGPTVAPSSPPGEAAVILRRYGLWDQVPSAIREVLGGAFDRPTPEPTDLRSAGDGHMAAEAVAQAGWRQGVPVRVMSTRLEGEAVDAASTTLRAAPRGEISVLAGETTVTVRGTGRGGRNQEAALAAALLLDGSPESFMAFGTDGIDGPTDAAGAYVDGSTAGRAREAGVDLETALSENDSHPALDRTGALMRTGPTGVNVADLWLVDRR